MPSSYRWFDTKALEWIEQNFGPGIHVLDVGPGMGKYETYLQRSVVLDAVEPDTSYIIKFELNTRYAKVFNTTIQSFIFEHECYGNHYDLVIMGDVLEHLKVETAQRVVKYFVGKETALLVQVPFLYKQDHVKKDDFEKHLQEDLTAIVMHHRYPDLVPLKKDDVIGVYVWMP